MQRNAVHIMNQRKGDNGWEDGDRDMHFMLLVTGCHQRSGQRKARVDNQIISIKENPANAGFFME